MKNRAVSKDSQPLQFLPSVDLLLQTQTAQHIFSESGGGRLTTLARKAVALVRETLANKILDAENENVLRKNFLEEAEKNLSKLYDAEQFKKVRRVINATGVIIHTNLGRAPLAEKARQAIFEEAARYCTLEYGIETGKRGQRGEFAERLLAELTSAESALIVNNCAAACILVLTVLAEGGEAILSRGEMVEIGGDFRIPDVLIQSGAILKEVGTTNRTKINDYENAVSENTKLLLKIHPSNYRIVGFTATPSVGELAQIARRKDVLLYEDAGSGAIFDLSKFGLTDEPVISDSIKAGADVVTFSGDKLFGGVQAGFIVGKKEIIERLRKHPLYRALRVDKIAYAAIQATLEIFSREKHFDEIPVLKMLSRSFEEMRKRTLDFQQKLRIKLDLHSSLQMEIIEGNSAIGGGSAPLVQPKTVLLSLKHNKISAAELEKNLRFAATPVVARIIDDKVVIDLRTVFEDEEEKILEILTAFK